MKIQQKLVSVTFSACLSALWKEMAWAINTKVGRNIGIHGRPSVCVNAKVKRPRSKVRVWDGIQDARKPASRYDNRAFSKWILFRLLSDRFNGSEYLTRQGIAHETAWDFWQNIMALGVIAVGFLFIAYIQLRRIKKLKWTPPSIAAQLTYTTPCTIQYEYDKLF